MSEDLSSALIYIEIAYEKIETLSLPSLLWRSSHQDTFLAVNVCF